MHQGTSLTELCGQGKHFVSFIETPRTPSEKTFTVVCTYESTPILRNCLYFIKIKHVYKIESQYDKEYLLIYPT